MLQEVPNSQTPNSDTQVKENWIKPEIKVLAVNENTLGNFNNPRPDRSTYGS
jgi:hypothetical protein